MRKIKFFLWKVKRLFQKHRRFHIPYPVKEDCIELLIGKNEDIIAGDLIVIGVDGKAYEAK